MIEPSGDALPGQPTRPRPRPAVAGWFAGLRAHRSTAVVLGDFQFVEIVTRRARESGRRVVATSSAGAELARQVAAIGRVDELIVQGDSFAHLHDLPPGLRTHARRLVVADLAGVEWRDHRGDPFADPIPLAGRAAKRTLDILVAALGLILLAPLLVLVMVAIRVDTPGPVLLRQRRVGAAGRPFTLLKLRTMVVNNDDSRHSEYVASLIKGDAVRSGGMYKLTDDRRVTRVGRVLRRYSLDEAPQLWNVLCGSMSLVGPRPVVPNEVELYPPSALQRLRVKPGLTGPWQVGGRCELTFDEMIELDTRYWREWSPGLELGVLLRTPMAVLSGRGAA